MTARSTRWSVALAALLASSVTLAAGATARINRVEAPPGTDANARAALAQSVRRHLSAAKLDVPLTGYSVSPSLVQLRRYVESSSKETKLVCLVDLALNDGDGRIVATVQGSASSSGATRSETIDAAAEAAVARLPSALHALNERKSPGEVAAR